MAIEQCKLQILLMENLILILIFKKTKADM